MSENKHFVIQSELNKAVGQFPLPTIRARMNLSPFQAVFRCDRIEFLCNQSEHDRVLLLQSLIADGGADAEVTLIEIF